MLFLLKLFVKDYEEVKNPSVREACGRLGGLVGLISNLFLCAIKVAAGALSGSIAIIADGINNLTDASSSVITLLGFKLASMPEDEDHPYGHARIEYLTGLFVSLIIIVVGVQLFITSVDKALHPAATEYSALTIGILVAAIAVKLWQSYFNIKLGKRINSVALIATGTDSRNDVIATSAVLLCVVIAKLTAVQTDGVMGCLVALFIIWSGITLVRETVSPLLGEAPDAALVEAIVNGVLEAEGVLGMHDLAVHNYGPGKIFASVHIEVPADGNIMESHDMVDNIERKLSEELNIHLVAHMDPIRTDDPALTELQEIISAELSPVEGIVGIHDFRMVEGPTHTNIIFDIVMTPSCRLGESAIKELVDKRLALLEGNYFTVITFDKAYIKL